MKKHFLQLACYNQWANKQIYAARLLDQDDYFTDRRAYFKSMHGTLNHLLAVDKLWFGRFTGNLCAPPLDFFWCMNNHFNEKVEA